MQAVNNQLRSHLEPVVSRLGYEFWGHEYHPGKKQALLRVYIDAEGGISADDCAVVSHHLTGVLDVEDPISGGYVLEVSSPGLDRPLLSKEHFQRLTGATIQVRLKHLVAGRRNITGVLEGLRDGEVLLNEAGISHALPYEKVQQARVVPEEI